MLGGWIESHPKALRTTILLSKNPYVALRVYKPLVAFKKAVKSFYVKILVWSPPRKMLSRCSRACGPPSWFKIHGLEAAKSPTPLARQLTIYNQYLYNWNSICLYVLKVKFLQICIASIDFIDLTRRGHAKIYIHHLKAYTIIITLNSYILFLLLC